MTFVPPKLRKAIRACVVKYRSDAKLQGIGTDAELETLLRQLYDSVRRVEYFFVLRDRTPSPSRGDPASNDFDPIRAAIHHFGAGRPDEAAWLAFLAIHFGIHRRSRWQLVREVYGSLDGTSVWDWDRVRQNPKSFSNWLAANHKRFDGGFGNHRKYMSLKPNARAGTTAAIESYANWIAGNSSHVNLLASFQKQVGTDRGKLFDAIYNDMCRSVIGFGRTGCFDFLCALGKLGIFPIEPASPYISGSTGPRNGAELLLTGVPVKKGASITRLRPKDLDQRLKPLGDELRLVGVRFAMQVLEDAICNWQKSPSQYVRFRG